jgi:hypothetical protein
MAGREPDGDGFLARWSRRKVHARTATPSAPASTQGVTVGPAEAGAVGREPDRKDPTDADMPPLESLTAESDYSGFLSRGVSEGLRRKALSRLFRSPAFNVVDGLDDYAEDFRSFAALGDIVTADMRHRMEQQARRLVDGAGEPVAGELKAERDSPPERADIAERQDQRVARMTDADRSPPEPPDTDAIGPDDGSRAGASSPCDHQAPGPGGTA